MPLAYEEFVDFIAVGATPSSVAVFRPSEATKERVENLIRREKNGGLSFKGSAELNHFLQIEHLMRLA